MDATKYIAAATFATQAQARNVYDALENVARSDASADAGYGIVVRHFMQLGDQRMTVAFLTVNKEPGQAVKATIQRIFAEHGGRATLLDRDIIAVLLLPLEQIAPRGGTETHGNFTRWRSGYE